LGLSTEQAALKKNANIIMQQEISNPAARN